jgi:dual-specificity kinase
MLPAHHSQYGYAHQNPYSSNTRPYPANPTLPAPTRLTTSYHSMPNTSQYSKPPQSPLPAKQPSYAPSLTGSQSASALTESQNRAKQPNWNEFYKNGIPKEIIVIDDTPPPDSQARQGGQENGTYASTAGRKRKIDQGYEIEYHDSPTYSTNHATFGSSTSASAHSGDRTTSIHTVTAPTSLESYGDNPANNSYEDVRVGQKRKRAAPQKETRAHTKRKAQGADPYSDYIPPAKPLKKAGEVHVPVIRDVSVI